MENSFLSKVYGYSKIKEELKLIQKWYYDLEKLGDKRSLLPRGILFYGPPGEGKTLIVREYSKSFYYPVFVIEGNSDNLEGEIVDAFSKARKEKNAVVVIDELDKLIEKDTKLIRVLQSQLDGFNSEGNILTLATSNDFRGIPEALLREGRFDRKFGVCPTDKKDFKEMIKGFAIDTGLNLTSEDITELTEDLFRYPVSTIRATFNNVSLRYGSDCTIDDILNIVDFISTGFANKNSNFSVSKNAAIHEAGHAIYLHKYCKTKEFLRIYFNNDGGNTVYKNLLDYVTIEERIETIRCALAGLIAEEIILGFHGVGCTEDLEKASESSFGLMNRTCVNKVDYFCGLSTYYDRKNSSEHAIKIFDQKTANFISKNYKIVKRQLKKCKKEMLQIASFLIKHQEIKRDGFLNILKE